ncbi:MAG: NADH-quinone oxidoreductase subunit N [Candidatus Tokpelaia sp. JSC189]|nr:MAG: NADH-quinone oxidoreductase subunit N [Candidatus Tokpelaia sp. JSC189]
MQTDLIVQLTLILPELLVALGAIVLLFIGVFSETNSYVAVTGLAIAILIAATILVVVFPQSGTVFRDALIIDAFSRFMKILTLISAFIVLVMSVGFARMEKFNEFEFPVLVLLAILGMMLMISAGNMLSLYLGLELQSLALYVLAAIDRTNLRSTEAGMKYFVLGALSSGMMLYGISLLYGYTGYIGFAEISKAFSVQRPQLGMVFGVVFVLAGLAFKISAVPFHMWTPDVYEGAPTPVTAFFASAPKVAAVALIVRVVMSAFSPEVTIRVAAIHAPIAWQQIIIFLAVASMALGAFAGIGQHNIKRLMAYSSITHMGYILVGLSAGTSVGVQSVIIYIVIYIAMTLGCFAFILAMNNPRGYVESIYDLAGLARKNPFMATIMTLHLFSLASIPPLAGFFGKWYTFSAAVGAGLVPLAVFGMLTSVIGAFYYLRIIKLMWFDESKGNFLAMPMELRLILALSGIFVLFYVFWGIWIMPWAETAAHSLV